MNNYRVCILLLCIATSFQLYSMEQEGYGSGQSSIGGSPLSIARVEKSGSLNDLHRAAIENDVLHLKEQMATGDIPVEGLVDDETALYQAAWHGSSEAASCLIAYGASPACDNRAVCESPIEAAAKRGHLETLAVLLCNFKPSQEIEWIRSLKLPITQEIEEVTRIYNLVHKSIKKALLYEQAESIAVSMLFMPAPYSADEAHTMTKSPQLRKLLQGVSAAPCGVDLPNTPSIRRLQFVQLWSWK